MARRQSAPKWWLTGLRYSVPRPLTAPGSTCVAAAYGHLMDDADDPTADGTGDPPPGTERPAGEGDDPGETEHLRDVFVEATGTDTATTGQQADRGSLLEDAAGAGVVDVVAEMRETLGFETDLDDGDLATVVERFYAGDDDDAIAAALGVTEPAVVRARLDLHLLRAEDADPELLAAVAAGRDVDADPEALERAEGVARAQRRARRVSERFRATFEERLTDADLEGRVIGDARADGLREAAEDIDPELDLSL
jgi:hypothetical protein